MCEGMTWHTRRVPAKLKKKKKSVSWCFSAHVTHAGLTSNAFCLASPRSQRRWDSGDVFGLWPPLAQAPQQSTWPSKKQEEGQPQLEETHRHSSLLGSNAWARSCLVLCCSNKALSSSSPLPRSGRQQHCKEEVRRLWLGLSLFIISSHS